MLRKEMGHKKIVILGALALSSIVLVECQNSRSLATSQEQADRPLDYKNTIEPIISNYCTTCHRGSNASADLDLGTYEAVVEASKNKRLLHRINDPMDPMPQKGLMPREERKKILQWADNGYPFEIEKLVDEQDSANSKTNMKPKVYNVNVTPVDLEKQHVNLLEKMSGHWIGKLNIMGMKMDWFCWDYRAISPSHVFGIYEGGTMGNLFTSFFVTNYKGTKTIAARNGGLLNGIYRTSYFLLDKAIVTDKEEYYRLVDAYGGSDIMWIELRFKGNNIEFKSYTSRFGMNGRPTQHMVFEGEKSSSPEASYMAEQLNFPNTDVAFDFSNGFELPNWGEGQDYITSASYIWEGQNTPLEELAALAQDPITINDMPTLGRLKVNLERSEELQKLPVTVYLSREPLTSETGQLKLNYGYIEPEAGNSVFGFPQLTNGENTFEITYLHPGEYYVTAIVDRDKNNTISKGDVSSKSIRVEVKPEERKALSQSLICNVPND